MESTKKIFVSYARDDRGIVERLAYALRTLRCDVWIDDSLRGGQAWWDVILDQIRLCDALVVAVSPSMLRSVACNDELQYASRIKRAIIPVLVEATNLQTLPRSILEVQIVNFTKVDFESGIRLASAVLAIQCAMPLDWSSLPTPPPAPVSYLSSLGERARSGDPLSFDDQLAIVARLEDGVAIKSDWYGIRQIAHSLLEREDTLQRTATRVRRLLDEIQGSSTQFLPDPDRRVGSFDPTGTRGVLLIDDGYGRTYELEVGTNIVGRGQDSSVRLADTGVSRRHMEISWDGNTASISDLGSTTGTTVNGEPVQTRQLSDGDVIRVGGKTIVYRRLPPGSHAY